MSLRHGAVRTTANVRDMPGPVQEPQVIAMSAQLLHGTVYGRPRRLRASTGEMPGMPCGASYTLPGERFIQSGFLSNFFRRVKKRKEKKNSSNGVDREKKRREKTCLNSWKGKNISDDLVSEIIKRIKLNINKISNPTRVPFLVFIQRRIRARSLVKLDKNFTQFLHSDASRPFVFLYPCVQSVHVKKKKRKRGPTSNVTRLSLIKSGDANDKRWIKLGGGGERKEGRNAIGNDPSFFLSPSMKFNFR